MHCFESCTLAVMTRLNIKKYLCHKDVTFFVVTFPFYFHLSWFITPFVTSITRRVSLVEQERPTLSEHSGIFLRLQDLVFLIFEFSLSILENIVGLHFFGHTVLSFILQFTASVFPHFWNHQTVRIHL
jgi:hypothetical protein